ncbi:MAG: hypothetical protein R3D89_13280 [Sphingomonadaceae bacterium]
MANINGTSGPDELIGTEADDKIVGGPGDDLLNGGAGTNLLIGNGGNDLFVIEPVGGSHTINGFEAGEGSPDVILLIDSGIEDFETLMGLAEWSKGATRFAFEDGSTLAIHGRKPGDLHPDDFRFETTANPLFDDEDNTVDFNLLNVGDYDDGTQYEALAGDDVVFLAVSQAAADAAGYDPLVMFDGGAGNDTIIGGALDDRASGGEGDDYFDLGDGRNTALGNDGDDTFIASQSSTRSRYEGDAGSDTLVFALSGGGSFALSLNTTGEPISMNNTTYATGAIIRHTISSIENFHVTGSDDDDQITVLDGDDVVVAGDGRNRVILGDGVDRFVGGADLDNVMLYSLNGDDLEGGAGGTLNTIQIEQFAGTTYDMAAGTAVDGNGTVSRVVGFGSARIHVGSGPGGALFGTDDPNFVIVLSAGHSFDLRGSNDDLTVYYSVDGSFDGGVGNNRFSLYSTPGLTVIDMAAGTISGDHGTGTIANFERFYFSEGDQIFNGSDLGESVTLNFGVDEFYGAGGRDSVSVRDGGDILDGGNGAGDIDTLSLANTPYLDDTDAYEGVYVNLQSGELRGLENGSSQISGFEQILGTALGDVIIGSSSSTNILTGALGDDELHSGGGGVVGGEYNTLLGSLGNDLLVAEGTHDWLYGQQDSDTFKVIDNGSADPRYIVLVDFTPGEDMIDLTDFGLAFADVQAAYTQINAHITLGSLVIDLPNSVGPLDSNWFVL